MLINQNFALDAPLRQSIDVHRILMYAELRFGLAAQYHLLQQLYKFYFENSIDIFERASLADIVCSSTLGPDSQDRHMFPDAQIARLWLDSNVLRREVMDLAGKARLKGIKGTPFVVFNRKYAVCGAQGEERFTQVSLSRRLGSCSSKILSDIVGWKNQ
jgi:predicted DsbA family dithiol-disulfide isomerase